MLHHMAPVAGGISDRQKNGFVFFAGFFKGLFAPGIPVHRVGRMLQQIGTGFVNQAVVLMGLISC